ncbi:uncharacterized protein LOC143291763 isoform X2 [Babylonia areolata]
MKKDTAQKTQDHPALTEEKNVKETYSPGRSGGTYDLPLGGRLVVPDGICSKKDTITCTVVPPNLRWRYTPSFPGEHLTSEIFVISGTGSLKQTRPRSVRSARRSTGSQPPPKTVGLVLPYYPPQGKHVEVNVKGMWRDECTWVDVGFIPKEGDLVELQVDRLGTFCVTSRCKTDQFEVTPNGGLFHSRLNRILTFRFPKKAVDTTITYNMTIEAIPEDRVAFCREFFSHDCADLLVASEFIDFAPSVRCDFRRMATIKLPLPEGVEVEGETSEEIVVLHKEVSGWTWVDSKYKFSRSSVTFDVKNPSRFCVVKTKPERQRKMQAAVGVLEERMGREKGQVNVFLSLLDKSWMGVVEVFPQSVAPAKLHARQEQGFAVVSKVEVAPEVSSRPSYSRRAPPPREYRPKQMAGFELSDGLTWTLEMEDDLQFGTSDDLTENNELCCFRHLKESYRRFSIVPATEEDRSLKGVLVLKPVGILDTKLKEQLTMSFALEIPEDVVSRYYYVPPPEPEPVKTKPKLDLPALLAAEQPKVQVKPTAPKVRTFSMTAMERLTQPVRRPNMPEKEAKVISGKSLMVLSKIVNEGLTLAVHLDLPDSTITGIGFDALSNNRSMSDVGYRILLYWKRTRKDKREGAVYHLLGGLRSMGKHGVARVVEERFKENKELTMDSFLMAAVSGVNIHD